MNGIHNGYFRIHRILRQFAPMADGKCIIPWSVMHNYNVVLNL